LASLLEANLIPSNAKRVRLVKKGDIKRSFVLKGIAATAGAKAAIEAAGGTLE
jgi:large subunit ribosomal protein L15